MDDLTKTDVKFEIIKTDQGLTDNAIQDLDYVEAATLPASELRAQALALKGKVNSTLIELAEILHVIYNTEKWKDFGFNSFEAYVETELSIGYRSAMYSVNIISKVKEHNIPMLQAMQLGWGRLRALLPHLTAKNAETLLDMASTKSVREIQTELKSDAPTGDSSLPETKKLSFDCTPAEAAVVFDALDEAKKRLDTQSISSALEFLAQEWLMANEGETSQTSLQDIITFCERNYGVILSAAENATQNLSERIEDIV